LCRTSRQWRCVSSARQQGEPVRRSRKRLHVGRGACRSGSDVQPGTSRKRPTIAKPTTPRHFSTASVKLRNTRNEQIFSALPPITDILGDRLAKLSSGGRECFHSISNMASALPAPEQADKDLQSPCRLETALIRYRPRYPVCV
jgi:hypothetical protein